MKAINNVLFILFIYSLSGVVCALDSNTADNNNDAAICASLPADPVTLPFVSYNSAEGFDECVARCVTNVMMQVCRQLPPHSNVFATQPAMRGNMLNGCRENIRMFVANRTHCPYLKCQP